MFYFERTFGQKNLPCVSSDWIIDKLTEPQVSKFNGVPPYPISSSATPTCLIFHQIRLNKFQSVEESKFHKSLLFP